MKSTQLCRYHGPLIRLKPVWSVLICVPSWGSVGTNWAKLHGRGTTVSPWSGVKLTNLTAGNVLRTRKIVCLRKQALRAQVLNATPASPIIALVRPDRRYPQDNFCHWV